MQIPSQKTLEKLTTPEKAAKIREILGNYRQLFPYSAPAPRNTFKIISEILGGYGYEYIFHGKNKKSPAIHYVNMGDTYETTVLFVNGRFRVGCWGDIVEKGNYE